jgi:DNA polymerase III gamma/tau subunit
MWSSLAASSLAEIPGHESAKKALRGLFQHQECHAVLLYGPENSACLELAHQLAASWLCPNADSSGACGTCPVCLGFWKETTGSQTLDYLEVVPKPPSRIIRVAAITSTRGDRPDPNDPPAVRDFFRTHPLQARQKVVCIVDADRLNPSAANALLKLLEAQAAQLKGDRPAAEKSF